MDKTIRKQDGFAMVELLMAIAIVGIILVIMMGFFKNSMTMRSDSKGSETAYLLGQEKLVELKAMAAPVDASDTVPVDKMKYIRSWTITSASGGTLLSVATVTVKYTAAGRVRSIKCYGGVN